MRKLPEVEYAKQIMTEAQNWSLWGWLFEKKRVRRAADDANAALAAAEQSVKDTWNDDLKRAYEELAGRHPGTKTRKRWMSPLAPEIVETARQIQQADEKAETVRLRAEDIFDEADRHLSAEMARQGTFVAIEAWTLREKAIRKAEAAARKYSPLVTAIDGSRQGVHPE